MSETKVRRRNILKSAAAIAGGALYQTVYAQSNKRRVLALIGDRYHNSDYIRVALNKVFDGLNVQIDYTIHYDELSAKALKDYQVFLCLRDGMIWPDGYLGPDAYTPYSSGLENSEDFPISKPAMWLKEEQAVALKDFVTAGNGFYSMHNNSHVSLASKTYRDVQGGAYAGHPTLRPFKVKVVNNSHPITQGVQDFYVTDEQHYVQYDKDPKHILLRAENTDGLRFEKQGASSVAGWAYDYGKGRVVFTSVGHTIHALWAPEYIKIQRRSLQWLLKEI